MGLKNIVLALFLFTSLSCNGLEQVPSQLDSKAKQAAIVQAQNTPKNDVKFYVSVEFVVYQSQANEYPKTAEAFQRAVYEWNLNLPISAVIYHEDEGMTSMFGRSMFASTPGIIEVLICDIQSPSFGRLSSSIVGMWDSGNHRLLLDADTLETNPGLAYSTALHELGHLFGLPHIVGPEDQALTGWLVLNTDAKNYVMYPSNVQGQPQDKLSKIEIGLATNYVVHHLTLPGTARKKNDCSLTHDE